MKFLVQNQTNFPQSLRDANEEYITALNESWTTKFRQLTSGKHVSSLSVLTLQSISQFCPLTCSLKDF